eukprot:4808428-Amphidinium_carterae.5
MEWPTSCTHWQKNRVKPFLKYHHLKKVDFHGCAVGLKSRSGLPIKKPWTLATNCLALHETCYMQFAAKISDAAALVDIEPKVKRQ